MKHARRVKHLAAASGGSVRENVFEVEVHVASGDSHQVDGRRVAQEHRESEQHPWQVRCVELEESEERHAHQLVASAPDVDHHECERRAQERRGVDERCNAAHDASAEDQEEQKICCAAAERTLLEKPAVAHEEEHVEEEVDAEGAKEEEIGEQPPQLQFHEDKVEVEVEKKQLED